MLKSLEKGWHKGVRVSLCLVPVSPWDTFGKLGCSIGLWNASVMELNAVNVSLWNIPFFMPPNLSQNRCLIRLLLQNHLVSSMLLQFIIHRDLETSNLPLIGINIWIPCLFPPVRGMGLLPSTSPMTLPTLFTSTN